MKAREFWKVCKKLSNEERLDVLRKVMSSPEEGGLPVGQIADAVRLGQPATSTYLAELQDVCGLVASRRAGRYCLYYPAPDISDAKAVALFKALTRFFLAERAGWAPINGSRPLTPRFLSVLPARAHACSASSAPRGEPTARKSSRRQGSRNSTCAGISRASPHAAWPPSPGTTSPGANHRMRPHES